MKRLKLLLFLFGFVIALLMGRVVAAATEDERIQALEARVAQLEKLIEEMGQDVPGPPGAPAVLGEKVSFSGLLEAEAAVSSGDMANGNSADASDIVLATVELGLEAAINDRVSGNLVLLWEEDDTEPLDIDIGTITWQGNGYGVTAGRFYPLFGTFNSSFISDPITLELGEIQQSGVQIFTDPEKPWKATLTVANGEVDKAGGGDKTNDFGIRVDYEPDQGDNAMLAMGAQYYSDIADTNAELMGGATGGVLQKTVGGVGLNFDWARGPLAVTAEYLGATKGFAPANLDANADGSGDKPRAWNFELAWALCDTHTLALKYEGSREFADFPKSQYGLVSSWDLGDGLAFSLEYLYASFDTAFSTMKNRHLLSSQLAVEF